MRILSKSTHLSKAIPVYNVILVLFLAYISAGAASFLECHQSMVIFKFPNPFLLLKTDRKLSFLKYFQSDPS